MSGWRIRAAVLVLSAAACGPDASSTSAGERAGPYESLYQALCVTRARAPQPDAAGEIFFDRVDQPIHELAAVAAQEDRAAAARLLEAKQVVESAIAGDGGGLADGLDRLLDATRRAIVATGQPEPQPCQDAP